MPEGDTIHKAAAVLRPLLVGHTVSRIYIRGGHHERLDGLTVSAVAATGKHLTIDLAGGEWQLRIHLGMNGRWRRYRAGIVPPASATLLLAVDGEHLACMNAPTVELTARRDARRGRSIASLGPDILAPDFAPAAAATRALTRGPTPIGVTLLDQRVVAGIGNVYKSEALFLERLSPLAPTSSIAPTALTALYLRAAALMRANVSRRGPRITRNTTDRYHVYRRANRPCPRCHTAIRTVRQGEQLRITYYCPSCQPLTAR
jgi:endonuclease-8